MLIKCTQVRTLEGIPSGGIATTSVHCCFCKFANQTGFYPILMGLTYLCHRTCVISWNIRLFGRSNVIFTSNVWYLKYAENKWPFIPRGSFSCMIFQKNSWARPPLPWPNNDNNDFLDRSTCFAYCHYFRIYIKGSLGAIVTRSGKRKPVLLWRARPQEWAGVGWWFTGPSLPYLPAHFTAHPALGSARLLAQQSIGKAIGYIRKPPLVSQILDGIHQWTMMCQFPCRLDKL